METKTAKNETYMLNVKLVVVGGAPEGDEFHLNLPCVMGRSREATMPMPHPLVSRRHCELAERDGLLFVRDLSSTNGTFVGSERVEECVIHDGDLLTIGTVTFRAVYLAESIGEDEVTQTERSQYEFDTSRITRVDTGIVKPAGPTKPTRKRQSSCQ